jgi:hypothetical protein
VFQEIIHDGRLMSDPSLPVTNPTRSAGVGVPMVLISGRLAAE